MQTADILNEPIAFPAFSRDFVRRCGRMGFERLEDILIMEPAALVGQKGFSYVWLGELAVFLKERGLLHLLQSIPGKSSG